MKFRHSSVFLLILLLILSGCGGTNKAASHSKSGGTLIVGMESDTDTLDPHTAGGWVTMRVTNQIFEPLIGEDLSKPSGEQKVPKLIPVLAKSWNVSKDGKTYTFNLRKNVKFTDGTKFDAKAAVFNLRRLTDPKFKYYYKLASARVSYTWQFYKAYKLINDYQFQIILNKPFSEFPRMLAQMRSAQMVSPAAVKKYGNTQFGNHPVGTGPFKFQSRQRGDHITLVKNDQYWGKKAYLNKVIFKPISNSASRTLALQNGSVDIIAVPTPDNISKLKKQGFKEVTSTPPHVWYLTFNMNNPAMKNIKVRQAINYAIDKNAIAENLLKGTVKPAYTIQSPANTEFNPNKKWYSYNPEKAKQLLKEAGYSKGLSTTLLTSVDGSGQLMPADMAQWIQRDLKKVGINVKIGTQEWISYLTKYTEGMPKDVGMMQMSSGRTTPYWLSYIANSKFKSPNGFNAGGYSQPNLDKILDQATTSVNQTQSLQLWKQAEKIMMTDPGWVPIVNDTAPYILGKNVHGFINPSEEWYSLSQVWLSGK
ncbi:MAG: ABC transporter substrate-binding protein [Sporolactobacillus sp.]|jgi:peptide/nickel transport system substrate-binding protein|nr:ABC transporter substrate-binding protein [Sporolactobacillus sp.]MCI1882440.1 ABC transporter substrate-binding protein [Sporolactobacillus sp.]